MIDFERELNHLLTIHLQGCIMGKTLIEKIGKKKYMDNMWDIVKKGADCIMEMRTTEEQREVKVMEGLNYLFTQYNPNDISKTIENHLIKEKYFFMQLTKKDANRILYENDAYTEISERWDKITPDNIGKKSDKLGDNKDE